MHTAGAPFSNEEAHRDTAAACVGSPQRDMDAAGVGSPQHSHSEDGKVHCSCCLFRLLRLGRPAVCYRFRRLQGAILFVSDRPRGVAVAFSWDHRHKPINSLRMDGEEPDVFCLKVT
ncbi:uncharacterized protein LOC119275252 isoform X2 [Triticum dicoccoides]|uniref:uncharacterized protein LOC119275252 isoform X2 n=1 Tax=Triticum dicoccoides TaxID=85692 RepID=UPI00188EA4A9|nr:uncharacterized protein LOC119275252 isoform X2 [Triticum dicoccoides]